MWAYKFKTYLIKTPDWFCKMGNFHHDFISYPYADKVLNVQLHCWDINIKA